tara:strand:+ start:373 stop:1131 length:759 start_codon:yes stop_codon:yes gene_type:complete
LIIINSMNLILLRHGESQWNLENKFTGWHDVKLTQKGIMEAEFAGIQLKKNNFNIVSIHTSLLNRAIDTAKIVMEKIGFPENNLIYNWRLNERHYGALQGLNKSETAKKYGEEQVKIWRRSFDKPPPLLNENDERHPKFSKKFSQLNTVLPKGESLSDVIERLLPFWNGYSQDICKNQGDHLIVAHSNSLRALVKILENLTDEKIIDVNIPTGVPLVYTLSENFNIVEKKYLIDDIKLKEMQKSIKNQGKIK